jgi:hypothetical protein
MKTIRVNPMIHAGRRISNLGTSEVSLAKPHRLSLPQRAPTPTGRHQTPRLAFEVGASIGSPLMLCFLHSPISHCCCKLRPIRLQRAMLQADADEGDLIWNGKRTSHLFGAFCPFLHLCKLRHFWLPRRYPLGQCFQ